MGERAPDSTDAGSAARGPLKADTYNSFVGALRLVGIEVVRVSGERRAPGQAAQTRFDLKAGWQANDRTILWRYDVSAHLTDENGTDFGTVEAAVVVAGESAAEVDPACIEQFGASSGAFMAHPYMRETVATTALRLGFTGVLLPMITNQPPDMNSESRPTPDGETG